MKKLGLVIASLLAFAGLGAYTSAPFVQITDKQGVGFSTLNPFPVSVVSQGFGTSEYSYQAMDTPGVASGGTTVHTVTAGTTGYRLRKIMGSASGQLRMDVRVNGTLKWTAFNSTSDRNAFIEPKVDVDITSGQTIQVTLTNREAITQAIYSTIEGIQK